MRPSLRPPWPKQSLLRWHPRAPQSIPRRIATTSSRNSAPADLPEPVLSPGSVHHNSLPTFLEYAKRKNLAPTRTYYVGTHYEYTAANALMRLGFSLTRIGRKFDAGIDLIGHWVLAPLPEPMHIIAQCKARKCSCTPSNIRELEGSFQGKPPRWRNKDVLGLLVTDKQATKGTLEAMGRSRFPMGFVMVTREGTIQQFRWNRAASERGLEGVGVTVRHTPRILLSENERQSANSFELNRQGEIEVPATGKARKLLQKFNNSGTDKDIQLTWMGSPIFPDRDSLDQRTLQLKHTLERGIGDFGMVKPETPTTTSKRARPRTALKASTQRIGVVMRQRGRPKGSTNAQKEADKVKRPGRPKGSKNKPKVVAEVG
jgi:hypothetical protein